MSRRLTQQHAARAAKPLPRWLRPKLAPDQVRDLALCHLQNLDAIAKGQADESTLWQWVGGCLTWLKVAELLGIGLPEMTEQMELVTTVVQRFGRTGRAVFTGPEYQLAKAGVDVMDQLAERVDRQTAIAAAEWSDARCNAMAAAVPPTQPTQIVHASGSVDFLPAGDADRRFWPIQLESKDDRA